MEISHVGSRRVAIAAPRPDLCSAVAPAVEPREDIRIEMPHPPLLLIMPQSVNSQAKQASHKPAKASTFHEQCMSKELGDID